MEEQFDEKDNMITCPDCDTRMPKDAKFCPKCGKKMHKKSGIGVFVTVICIVICTGVLGVGGYFGYKFYVNNYVSTGTSIRDRMSTEETTSRRERVALDIDVDDDSHVYFSSPLTDKLEINSGEGTTVMVYMIGSNLETESGCASSDIQEMMEATSSDDLNIVIQTGGAFEWQMDEISDGEVERFAIENGKLVKLDNLSDISMVREESLIDFIKFASQEYPAGNYVLVLWDHGGGIPVGFGQDELHPNGTIEDVELGSALEEAGVHFAAIVFDACNMCTLEVAMAVKDNADYMVAAESYVNGVGIYYTNWLSDVASDDTVYVQDYCETIVSDYMDSLASGKMVGSMSVLNLGKIDAVYESYIDYIGAVADHVSEGDYAGYINARANCGYYEGTDSVDICTLCNQYPVEYSTELFNNVVNAVVYTESDFYYGHGLTAYSPYENFHQYKQGRGSLVALDYDDTIVNFYDRLVSSMLDFEGDNAASRYGGAWYVSSTEPVEQQEPVSTLPTRDLEVEDCGRYFAVSLSDEQWDNIKSIAVNVYVEIDEDLVMWLGSDYYYEFDDAGRLKIIDPGAWVYVNGKPVTYQCVDYYSDDDSGEWSQMGYIYCDVNGEEAFILVYYDEEHPDGIIQGYYYADHNSEEIKDYTLYSFDDDDVIDMVYYSVNTETDEEFYVTTDDPMLYKDIELEFLSLDLSHESTYLYYILTDIFGNSVETEMVYLYI